MPAKMSKAAKRREIANAVEAEWKRRGFRPEQGEYTFFSNEMEAYAVGLMTVADGEGYCFSQSQYDPIRNGALNCLYDAYRVVQREWEAAVLGDMVRKMAVDKPGNHLVGYTSEAEAGVAMEGGADLNLMFVSKVKTERYAIPLYVELN